jgi:uncharacterized protein
MVAKQANHHFSIGWQKYFAFLCNMKNHWMETMNERQRLLLFMALSFVGIGVGSMFMFGLAGLLAPEGVDPAHIFAHPTSEHAELLKWSNTVMLIGFFLLPVWNYQTFLPPHQKLPFHFKKFSAWWLMAPFLLFFLSGMVDLVGTFNAWLMDQWQWQTAEELQNDADGIQEIMLHPKNFLSWCSTIIAVVIAPAILEELFFRGALQNIFIRLGRNHHLAIWFSAIAFSAVHLQFEGFLPRTILGALMGYLYHWSGSLTTSMIAHAFNNVLALVLFQYLGNTEWNVFESPLMECLLSFALGFVGLALTQWTYRKWAVVSEEIEQSSSQE